MELKTIGLTKKYGSKAAVNALDITLTNGVYGLLGANGAGKTTLMRLLCNIQRPTSGKILLDGRNIVELGEKYRNLLGYLPQHFGYYPDFSAFDFLLYVSALKGLDEKAARKKSKELLEAVGLAGNEHVYPAQLSGGMQKRVGLARALALQPDIILYDEPTAGLDPIMATNISQLILDTKKKLGITGVLVTHDMASAFLCADRILMLSHGHIAFSGTVEEARHTREPLVRAFLRSDILEDKE